MKWYVSASAACILTACSGTTIPSPPGSEVELGFVLTWGQQGSGDGEFSFPIGLAIDHDVVHVTDYRNHRIQRFDTDGRFLSSFATAEFPGAITIDPATGLIWVSHGDFFTSTGPTGDKIVVYDSSGAVVREFGQPPSAPCSAATVAPVGEFDKPGGIAIGNDGRVYIADQQNHRIQVFDRDGNFLSTWGKYGPALGEFGMPGTRCARVAGPHFIAIDGAGSVWTTEGSVRRVQQFTPDGASLGGWVKDTEGPGGFAGGMYAGASGPVALTFDHAGRLWIGSPSQGTVQQFASDGTFLQSIGGIGTEPGLFHAPHALAFDSHGDLFVVDLLNHRVQKFRVE